ncbi:unnamed protein product [Effrenium voratum]|nr:unnamed protein product [Effrenium voratum]
MARPSGRRWIATLLAVPWVLSPAFAIPRAMLRAVAVPWLWGLRDAPAEAQVNAGLRSLTRRSRPRPETGVQISGVGVMEGEDASGARVVAAEVSSGKSRVEVSFLSPWPVTSEKTMDAKGLEVRSKGASAFLQVIQGSDLSTDHLLEEVLSSKGKFGAYGLPEAIQVLSDESDDTGRRVQVRFTAYSPKSVEFETRALLRAKVLEDTTYVLVATALEDKWAQAEAQLVRTVDSFQVAAA